jgi:two-component system sensor histidine kinase/response regulator
MTESHDALEASQLTSERVPDMRHETHMTPSGVPGRTSLPVDADARDVTRTHPPVREPARRILLAEDNPVNQRVAVAMLEHLGFHVDVVADGAAAVKAATSTTYRAILMDCQLPVLDGYQATSEIRRLQRASPRTPIIAVTATPVTSDQPQCAAAGMDDYLPKPLSLPSLAAVLALWAPDGPVPAGGVVPAQPLPSMRVDLGPVAVPLPPVLDPEVIGRLQRLGEDAGEELVGQLAMLFLAGSHAWVVALRKALASHDAAAVARSAHTLSGASANVGATDLARLCATLAKDSAAGDLAGGGARLETVEAELRRVRAALGSLIPTP